MVAPGRLTDRPVRRSRQRANPDAADFGAMAEALSIGVNLENPSVVAILEAAERCFGALRSNEAMGSDPVGV